MNYLDNANIQISEAATGFLRAKIAFFRSKARVPRIVLTGRSCHGAEFRLFFEVPKDDDEVVSVHELQLFIPAGLIAEFGGFAIDVEQFFFAKRLLIVPLRQSFSCDCDKKCKEK